MSIKEVQKYLEKENFNPSKKMGQNFLINNNLIIKCIKQNLNLSDYDLVIEIGPGLGALTEELLVLSNQYFAIELDKRLYEYCRNKYINHSNFKIVNDDFLKFDLNNFLIYFQKPLLVSNLPYSISSPSISKFLKTKKIDTFCVMLQKEMVDHITAKVNSKNYNAFSCICSYYLKIKNICDVDRTNFYPQPNVDSCIIILYKNKNNFDVNFESFLYKSFAHRRKTLINNLKMFYQVKKVEEVLNKLNIDLKIRAQQLDAETLHKIYEILGKNESIFKN